jgi:Ca-activated chloride channel family protein
MFRFESPWMFLLLILVPLVFYLHRRGKPRGAVRFSTTADAGRAGRSLRQRLLALPLVIRAAVLVLVVIALARPQMGTERVLDTSRGIAIEMVIDRSSSMAAELRYRGRPVNRLDVAVSIFEEFVAGGGGNLKGRPSDLTGLITFARYPDTICPLTLAHDALTGFLPTVRIVQRQSEDGTAIGDAVALAAARLEKAEEALTRQTGEAKEYEIKSKVIILLTDGENNAGERTIQEAAELAAAWGVKIYAIGIGSQATSTIRTPLGSYSVPMGRGVDKDALKTLAETTGGMARIADDAEALRSIYEEIDEMEKSEIESFRFLDYHERFELFALAALALLSLEVLLSGAILRRIP